MKDELYVTSPFDSVSYKTEQLDMQEYLALNQSLAVFQSLVEY